MARFGKSFRKYEKVFLTGLVVVLLATFSVSGIIRSCGGDKTQAGRDFGGSFQPAPGKTVQVSTDEFLDAERRYQPVFRSGMAPSVRWGSAFFGMVPNADMSLAENVWAHLVGARAAEEAGYRVGEEETADGVKQAVSNWRIALEGRRPDHVNVFSAELYDMFMQGPYNGGSRPEFEGTVREMLLREKFLSPIVDGMRWSRSKAEGYEKWKASAERVDLAYVAVPSAQFEGAVGEVEATRTEIAKQSDLLGKVVAAGQVIRTIVGVAEEAKKGGALPKDEADLQKTKAYEGGIPTDPWKHPFGYKAEGDVPKAWSAGPDGVAGNDDDVTLSVAEALQTLATLRQVGDALVAWKAATGAWPASVADLTKSPPPPTGIRALALAAEDRSEGLVVAKVEDKGPARRAGVLADDRIVSWAGTPTKDRAGLEAALANAKPGDKGDLVVDRKGQTLTLKVALDRALPAPLAVPAKDAWGKEISFVGAGPSIASPGPNGVPGDADDVGADVAEAKVTLTIPARLGPFARDVTKDAWGRPLRVRMASALPPRFEITSDGKDGVAGNDDDVLDGNASDLAVYFARPAVKDKVHVPVKMGFEALWVAMPLVGDDALKAAWEKFPEYRPTEDDAWAQFTRVAGRNGDVNYYQVSKKGEKGEEEWLNPADPETGHGAALVVELVKAGAVPPGTRGVLVPSGDDFGEQKDPPKPKEGTPPPADDPLRKAFVEKGWRRIVLRELFFDRCLASFLKKANEARTKHKAWEDGGKKGDEPPLETFPSLLSSLRDVQPGEADRARGGRFVELYATKEPLARKDWGSISEISDINTEAYLANLKEGEFSAFPVVIKQSCARVALHCTKVAPARDPDLDEVRGDIWPGYVSARAMDRAAKELDKVKEAAAKPDARIEDAVKAVAGEGRFTWSAGTTGLFQGSGYSLPRPVPEGIDDERKVTWKRRAYARSHGYAEANPRSPKGEVSSSKVGALGRTILKDEGSSADGATGCAYLVQVREQRDPAPEEFTATRWQEWLRENAYDMHWDWQDQAGRQAFPGLNKREGFVNAELARWYGDWEKLRSLFAIKTNEPVEPKSRE